MADASSLHCPNCGAAVDPDVGRCPYCRARLATLSCPSCFALMFETAEFCQTCGKRRARAEAGEAGGRCPGCQEPLQRVDLEATTLLECGSCDGVWIDAVAFERLCSDRAAQASVLHRFPGTTAPRAERVRYRPCVQCGKMMNRVNFGKLSGTVVDVCRGHGTFLDAGELHRIIDFIHGGGLERSRQRQIEELREQERRLEMREWQAARDRGSADPHKALGMDRREFSAAALIELIQAIKPK